jgi:hypothetical protein
VAAELVAATINGQVRPYLLRHGVTGDGFLGAYIRDLMGTVVGIDTTLEGSAWETKALAIISTMNDIHEKVKATLELMRRASVPCSAEVDALVVEILQQPGCPRIDEIREQRRLMDLKAMMQKYGIRHFNFTDTRLTRGLLRHVLSRFDIGSELDDALQLIGAYNHLHVREAYVIRFQNLLLADRLDEAQALTNKVPADVLVGFGREVVQWADFILDDGEETGCTRATLIGAVSHALDTALTHVDLTSATAVRHLAYVKERCIQYERLATLQRPAGGNGQGFGISLTSSEIRSEAACRQTLGDEIKRACGLDGVSSSAADASWSMCQHIYSLAKLLNLPREAVVSVATSLLLEDEALVGMARFTIRLFQEAGLDTNTADGASLLYHLACALGKFCLDAESGLLESILAVAQRAMRTCSKTELPRLLEVWRSFDLSVAVERQCESGDYGAALTPTMHSADSPADEERDYSADDGFSATELVIKLFPARYKEEGLVMNSKRTTALASEFTQAVLPPSDANAAALTDAGTVRRIAMVGKKAKDLAGHLLENGLEQLALRHVIIAVGVCSEAASTLAEATSSSSTRAFRAFLSKATSEVLALTETILSKVLRANRTDRRAAMGYITILDRDPAFQVIAKALSTCKRNYARQSELFVIGAGFWKMSKGREQDPVRVDECEKGQRECESIRKNVLWYARLTELGVPFEKKKLEGADKEFHATELAPALIEKSGYDLAATMEFVDHYGLDRDYLLLAYVQSAVARPHRYKKATLAAVGLLGEKSTVLGMLKADYASMVNPYDYERLEFVCELIDRLELECGANEDEPPAPTQDWLSLLGVLKMYTRTEPASAYETDFTLKNELLQAPAAVVAARLPFHHLVFGEPLLVLTPELSFESVFKLAPLAPVLPPVDGVQLTQDDIITALVTKLYAEPAVLPPLGKVKGLIQRLSDFEQQIMQANLVADKYPIGPEKLEALELGVAVAAKYRETAVQNGSQSGLQSPVTPGLHPADGSTLGGSAEARAVHAHTSLRNLYYQTLTEWELQENGYSSEGTHALVVQLRAAAGGPASIQAAERLIEQLYEEFLIAPQRSVEKLHAVADGIAERYDVQLDQLVPAVVDKWLIDSEVCASSPALQASASASAGAGGGSSAAATRSGSTASAGGRSGSGGSGGMSFAAALDSGDDDDDDDHDDSSSGSSRHASPQPAAASSMTVSLGHEMDNNMQRAVALLRRGPPEPQVSYLLKFTFDMEDSIRVTPRAQFRALQALFQITSTPLIVKVMAANTERYGVRAPVEHLGDLHAHVMGLLYVIELEKIGVHHTPSSFKQCNKPGLARSIWKNHRHEASAISLTLDLCIDCMDDYVDTKLWSNLLKLLLQRRRWNDVTRALTAVSAICDLWQIPCILDAWKTLLAEYMKRVTDAAPKSAHQRGAAAELVQLATSCPVLLQVSPEKLAQQLSDLGLAEAASTLWVKK